MTEPPLYALIAYLPPPLGSFLDRLRSRLVAGCKARSHITLLPPRPLEIAENTIAEHLAAEVPRIEPMIVELGEVKLFDSTSVVYLSVTDGADRLQAAHTALNHSITAFEEPYPYHPHVTLAQDFPPEQADSIRNIAAQDWANWRRSRQFTVERAVFVRADKPMQWKDLAKFSLGPHKR